MNYPDDFINQIVCGDCLEVMKSIPNASINMVLADLPYNLTQNKWDCMIPLDRLWEQYKRIIKPTAVIALTTSQPFTSMLVMSNLEMFRHEWIWIKNRGSNFANTVREPFKEHETVLIFSNGHWTYNKQMQERTGGGLERVKYGFSTRTETTNYGKIGPPAPRKGELRLPSSWQKFNTEVGSHPTQKPVALFEYLIKTYSNEGDLVLDNTAGSCTTAVAARNLKRNWICIELDQKYCDVGKQRLI